MAAPDDEETTESSDTSESDGGSTESNDTESSGGGENLLGLNDGSNPNRPQSPPPTPPSAPAQPTGRAPISHEVRFLIEPGSPHRITLTLNPGLVHVTCTPLRVKRGAPPTFTVKVERDTLKFNTTDDGQFHSAYTSGGSIEIVAAGEPLPVGNWPSFYVDAVFNS
jgi:hypothetical protein